MFLFRTSTFLIGYILIDFGEPSGLMMGESNNLHVEVDGGNNTKKKESKKFE